MFLRTSIKIALARCFLCSTVSCIYWICPLSVCSGACFGCFGCLDLIHFHTRGLFPALTWPMNFSCRTFPTIWRNNGRQPRLPLCSCVFLGLRHSRQSDANTQLPLLISVCVYGVISNEPPCSLPSTAVTCPDALELRSKHSTIDSHSANTPSVTLGNHSVKKLNSSRRSLSHSFSHLLSDALQHPVTCPHLILSLSLSICWLQLSFIFVLFSLLPFPDFARFPHLSLCFFLCLFIYLLLFFIYFFSFHLSEWTSKNTWSHLQVLSFFRWAWSYMNPALTCCLSCSNQRAEEWEPPPLPPPPPRPPLVVFLEQWRQQPFNICTRVCLCSWFLQRSFSDMPYGLMHVCMYARRCV